MKWLIDNCNDSLMVEYCMVAEDFAPELFQDPIKMNNINYLLPPLTREGLSNKKDFYSIDKIVACNNASQFSERGNSKLVKRILDDSYKFI